MFFNQYLRPAFEQAEIKMSHHRFSKPTEPMSDDVAATFDWGLNFLFTKQKTALHSKPKENDANTLKEVRQKPSKASRFLSFSY